MTSDSRYCRDTLPDVSRTFAVNIRLLGGRMRDAVTVGYLLCRAADTLEDSWPGAGLEERFGRFEAALEGDGGAARSLAAEAAGAARGESDLELVANLPRVLGAFFALPEADRGPVREGVHTLASGMLRYAGRAARRGTAVAYLDTDAELEDYCWVVAGCVGVMLTRLYAASHGGDPAAQERRLQLAPIVGRALQLTNILLDWPNDVRRGRCYLPASWLAEVGLSPADLVARERPEVRALALHLEAKALEALGRVPDYLDLVPLRHVRYRLFCLWPAMWAVASLRQARRDPQFPWGPQRPKLPRSALYRASLGSLLTTDHGGRLRRLCEAAAR